MYKVILVDDDYPVLEYLNKSIPWEEIGFKVQGCYENGALAFEDVKNDVPDVVITDIGMPIMNGLELIQALREINATFKTIILSCHDEFHFAQQALKLNVHDYILKETLRPQGLIDVLVQLKNKMDEENRTVEESKTMKQWLKTKLFTELLEASSYESDSWLVKAKGFGLDLEACAYIPVLCHIHFRDMEMNKSLNELVLNEFEYQLGKIGNKQKKLVISYTANEFFLLYPESTMNLTLEHMKLVLSSKFSLASTFLVGRICHSADELQAELHHLLNTEEQRFYIFEGSIVKNLPLPFSFEDLFKFYTEALEEFRIAIIDENMGETQVLMKKWMEHILKERYRPQIVKEWSIKILLDLKQQFKSLQNFESAFVLNAIDQSIYKVETIFQLRSIMNHFLDELVSYMAEISKQPKRSEIIKAQKFIMMNLHKKISLAEVADYLHLNSSYFSRLFKKETNENFVEYVMKIKMERAKELLNQTNYTIEDVSEMLGFDSKSYFIKTFKNYVGMAPFEYRNKHHASA